MKNYNWDAKDYLENSAVQQRWGRELIRKLNLSGTEHVLDIGCGEGKLTADLSTLVPNGKVVGVDSSPHMIALAKEGYPPDRNPNLSFQIADARHLKFSGDFDVVFSNAALHWIRDHQPVLQGIWQSLKPRGSILLQMGGKGNAAEIVTALNQVILDRKWQNAFKGFTFPYGFHSENRYRQWLKNNGFNIHRLDLVPKDMIHSSPTELAGWFRTTWLPYLECIEEERRTEFVDDVVTRYCRKFPPDEIGRTHVRMVRLEVQASKAS